jgi:hypothetical protein
MTTAQLDPSERISDRAVRNLITAGISVLLLVLAFRPAWLSTHDLEFPFDLDLYRDAAAAESILKGEFPADPYYASEQIWYNPLAPAAVAGIARLTGLGPVQVYAHCGALVGLLIPLAILFLAIVLFGRLTGIGALFAFLFLGPNDLFSWAAPCYSPWLFANLLSLVPFAVALAAAGHAHKTGRVRSWAICGLLVAVTFLAHTASAIIAGSVSLALAWDRKQLRVVAVRWEMIGLVSFAVSTPFLISILWHYHLHIQNRGPLDYVFSETDVHRAGELLWNALNLRNAAALTGLVLLFQDRRARLARCILVSWIAVGGVLLLCAYGRQLWPGGIWPGLLPAFHWLFHLRLAALLLVGYALFRFAVAVAERIGRSRKIPALAILLVVLFCFQYPKFLQRADFVEARQIALDLASPDFRETVAWIRRETSPDAVILASPRDALVVLGAAGRKAIALEQEFSNPYVVYPPRLAAVNTMFDSLANHRRDDFLQTATKYRVSYVLFNASTPEFVDHVEFIQRCLTAPFVSNVFTRGSYAILRVDAMVSAPD